MITSETRLLSAEVIECIKNDILEKAENQNVSQIIRNHLRKHLKNNLL